MEKQKALEIVQLVKSRRKEIFIQDVLIRIEDFINSQVIFSYHSLMMFVEKQMSGKLGGNFMYINKALDFLKNELKAEYKKSKNKYKIKTIKLETSKGIQNCNITKSKIKPKSDIPFEIDFCVGTNPYKGFQYLCTIDNFSRTGIAKVNKIINRTSEKDSNGNFIEIITYEPSDTNWYVKHLDDNFREEDLFNKNVFNRVLLEALQPIVNEIYSCDID